MKQITTVRHSLNTTDTANYRVQLAMPLQLIIIIIIISSTSSRPDIVLVSNNDIILLELSVVTNNEEHFKAASSRKEARYGPLVLPFFGVSLSPLKLAA